MGPRTFPSSRSHPLLRDNRQCSPLPPGIVVITLLHLEPATAIGARADPQGLPLARWGLSHDPDVPAVLFAFDSVPQVRDSSLILEVGRAEADAAAEQVEAIERMLEVHAVGTQGSPEVDLVGRRP